MRSIMERESVMPVPMSSASIEPLAVYLFFGTLALALVPAAFLLAASEKDPVTRRTAVRLGTPALLAILIEIDYHRRLPTPSPRPSSASRPAECNRPLPQIKRSRASLPGAGDSPFAI